MNASRLRRLALSLFAVILAPHVAPRADAAESNLNILANMMKADEEKAARLREMAVNIDEARVKKDYPAAIAILDQAIEMDPHDATWRFTRGHIRMWLGEYDAASEDFDRAIENDNYTDDVLKLGLAELNLYTGKYADAEETLADALSDNYGPTRAYFEGQGRRDDDDAIAAYGRGRCWLDAPTLDGLKANQRELEKSLGLDAGTLSADPEDARSPEKALAEFNRAIALRPTLAPAYAWRGKIHAESGAHHLALEDFSRAIELDPENIANLRGRAEAREATGDLDGAIADWSRYIERRPDTLAIDDDGRFHRARAHAKKGEFDLAIADYNKAERSHTTSYRLLIARAFVHGRRGDIDSAMADIRKGVADEAYLAGVTASEAIETDPGNALAHIALGFSHAAQDRNDRALDEFAKAVDIDPGTTRRAIPDDNLAATLFNRGVDFAKDKQLEAALADFNRAIALDPDSAHMLGLRGTLHGQMKNTQLALDDFNRSLQLKPDDAGVRFKRGSILGSMKEDELAIADFTRVIELQPENAQAWFRRAVLHQRLGFADRFQADYARAIELDPSLKR